MSDGQDRFGSKGLEFVLLAEGQLWHLQGDSTGEMPQQIRSQFASEMKERLLRIHKRNEWKTQGSGAMYMGGAALWSSGMSGPGELTVSISAISDSAEEGQFYFVMHANEICGLFSHALEEGEEHRLFHGPDHTIHAIDYGAVENALVCSVSGDDGLHNLALMRPGKGGGFQEITEGDSLDTYPMWVPDKRQVVYQTAGIGRNRYGDWVETAPCEIAKLDFETGEIVTLLEGGGTDFLLPRVDENGDLFCIRRPYQKARGDSFFSSVKDLVLFPVRLLGGILGFLNFFTSVFSGKPLISNGAARAKSQDAKKLILYGNLVDAEKVARENTELADEELSAVVPRSWELVCYPDVGEARTIARGVMAYTICPGGGILYSNGRGVFRTDRTGEKKPELIVKKKLVQQIRLVKRAEAS